MKLFILTLIVGFSVFANAETQLTCVASSLSHQTLSLVEDTAGIVRVQKYVEGNDYKFFYLLRKYSHL